MRKIELSKEFLEEELKTQSPKEIAEKIGCCIDTIRRKIRESGIKRTKHAHLINHDYFKNWSNNMAYVLGFVFADGTINTSLHHNVLKIELSDRDGEVLEFIRDEIQPTLKIYEYQHLDKRSGVISKSKILSISSKEIVKDLINLGCIPNKSYKEIRVPNIETVFQPDFVRGYFDGDGTVYHSRKDNTHGIAANISCSSCSFLKDIKNIVGFGKIETYSNPIKLSMYSYKDIYSLYEYMYNNGFCLKRKFDKYTNIVNYIKEYKSRFI